MTLYELLTQHYPVRNTILSRIGSTGCEVLVDVYPKLLDQLTVANDLWFFSTAIPVFCGANQKNPLFFDVVYPIVCYISRKAPYAELYDMLHHLCSNFHELGTIGDNSRSGDTVLRTLMNAMFYFVEYSCYVYADIGTVWPEDLERVGGMAVTFFHDFDLGQVREDLLENVFPQRYSRYAKCISNRDNLAELRSCCHNTEVMFGAVDSGSLLRSHTSSEDHVCDVRDGPCQNVYKEFSRSGAPPVVEFMLLCHLVKYHLRFWVASKLGGKAELRGLRDRGSLFHQSLNFVYFLENTNFLTLVKLYLLDDLLN